MKFWQIRSGDGNVDLEDVFLKLNIAVIGPGGLGDYYDHRDEYAEDKENSRYLKYFCEDVQVDDFFVLIRPAGTGLWQIRAVGKVIGAYRYELVFKDIQPSEWNMQHCRRVKWEVDLRENPEKVSGGVLARIQKLSEDNNIRKTAERILSEQE